MTGKKIAQEIGKNLKSLSHVLFNSELRGFNNYAFKELTDDKSDNANEKGSGNAAKLAENSDINQETAQSGNNPSVPEATLSCIIGDNDILLAKNNGSQKDDQTIEPISENSQLMTMTSQDLFIKGSY